MAKNPSLMRHSFLRLPIVHFLLITVLVFGCVVGLRGEGYLESMELDAYDWSLRLRPHHTSANPPITVIAITDQDIGELGRWPITDETLARVLGIIAGHHPRVVGIDIYRDLEVPPGRPELDRVLEAHPEMIMVMKFGSVEKGGILAPAILRGTNRVGFTDIVVDSDGVVRRGLLFLDDGGNFYQSFGFLLAQKYLEQESIIPERSEQNPIWVKMGKTTFRPFESNDGGYVGADAQGYQFLLDLDRREHVFPTVPLRTILSGDFNPEAFRDRIVLIGVVAEGVKDFFYTSQCGSVMACPPLSGIELHGYMVYQLLRAAKNGQATIATFSDAKEMLWIGVWVLAGGLLGLWVRGAWRFSLVVLMGILGLSGVVVVGSINGVWLPFVAPAMGWVINSTVVTAWISNREKQDRALLMSLFSRHVSPEVAQAVWEQRDQFMENGRLRPRKLVATTLFADLEGFTTVAESMEPGRVLDWLNTYMEKMVHIINAYGGVVDDFHGDMIKADFGVFQIAKTEEDIRQDVQNAVRCAVALEQEMCRLQTTWNSQGLPTVRMRIGIHTGPVVAGSLGSAQRLKYTTIGDTVNIASRLESYQKDLSESWAHEDVCRILMGETTKESLGDHPWDIKEVGVLRLKGKAIGVRVYKLCSRRDTF